MGSHRGGKGPACPLAGKMPGTSQRLPAWPPPESLPHDCCALVTLELAVGALQPEQVPRSSAPALSGAQRGRSCPGSQG